MQNQNISLPYDGTGYNCAVVASFTLEDWLATESKRSYTHLPTEEQTKRLTDIHTLCTEKCAEAGLEVAQVAVKPKRKSKKAASEGPESK